MELRYPLQLQTVIKALNEVILPALDPHNQPAQEQARLVLGMLALMAQQLPLEYRFHRDQLRRGLALAQTLLDAPPGEAAGNLGTTAAHAAEVLRRAGAEPEELYATVCELRAALAATVQSLGAEAEKTTWAAARQAVLAAAKEQLLVERSWYLMQGWEPDPQAVPPIDTLLK